MILFVELLSGAVVSLTIDEAGREAYVGGRPCGLTQQEFALLYALAQNVGHVVSRPVLLKSAWGYQSEGDTRTVDMHIKRLRGKLGAPCIETVYRAGYRLVARKKSGAGQENAAPQNSI